MLENYPHAQRLMEYRTNSKKLWDDAEMIFMNEIKVNGKHYYNIYRFEQFMFLTSVKHVSLRQF